VKEAALLQMLGTLEARIGTKDAQPGDFESIIACIHQIMSALSVYMAFPECEEFARANRWVERRAKQRRMSEQ
jgi:uncharacterized protein YwlG (UPF0340 family)